MNQHAKLLAEIEALPDGSHIGAFFDFDGTVISGFSAFTFIREQVKRGDFAPQDLAKLVAAMSAFGLGRMGFSAMMSVTMQFMRGEAEQQFKEFGEFVYQKHIARLVYPESRALVEAHLRKGHTVAIISSATPYQVEPAARDLDIEHVVCTRLEIEDGLFTGRIVRPTCFGMGKVTAANDLAERYNIDLHDSYFYSDSDDDLQLLEAVGYPRVLNPNRKLSAIAYDRDWPIYRFSSRGRAGPDTWARSIAATGSLITSFLAGLPIWAITGSKRTAQNFSFSLFADTASALIGLDLNVKGQSNLWVQRPAVFVFNHQSKADVVIIASLLRRDIAGVGKKEIKSIPVIGQIMQFSGVIFIDRKNGRSAIEAMKPLVDAMKNEAKSVVISPEGTRTVSPKLGPFKKGAFHLAMQAGVPIIPIVIRNALDVAPKGEFVFRPATVDIEVLPPIETSAWRSETIADHVQQVRQQFLVALGQASPATDESAIAQSNGASANGKSTPKAKAREVTKSKGKTKKRAKKKVTKSGATKKKTKRKTRTIPRSAKKKADDSATPSV